VPGERPYTLLDYFDFAPAAAARQPGMHRRMGHPGLKSAAIARRASSSPERPRSPAQLPRLALIIDESHVTLPQVRAMYNGDRNRKQVLVEHGFRLPARWTTAR
jgi:hypothetical protein